MLHFLGHIILWHAVGRMMHGLGFWQAALIALLVIVVLVSFSRRRYW
jgi:uncharacterized membrane protein YccF (DUF307 family)